MQQVLQEGEWLFHVTLQYHCGACQILWKNINYNLPSSCWLHLSKPWHDTNIWPVR